MIFSAQCLLVPKGGHGAEGYEDAFAMDEKGMRFGVSDGATESSFSGAWAKDLVTEFVTGTPTPAKEQDWQAWLQPIQEKWHARINWGELPWFAIDKARDGAFSTLLGLEFHRLPQETADGACVQWKAVAAGDSCLFQLRDGVLLTAFPISNSKEFNSHPLLLASNPKRNTQLVDTIRWTLFSPVQVGDRFLLATDALADWFLRQHEAGKQPAEELARLTSQENFAEWTAQQRKNGLMRNDDVTLVMVHCLPPFPPAAGGVSQVPPSP